MPHSAECSRNLTFQSLIFGYLQWKFFFLGSLFSRLIYVLFIKLLYIWFWSPTVQGQNLSPTSLPPSWPPGVFKTIIFCELLWLQLKIRVSPIRSMKQRAGCHPKETFGRFIEDFFDWEGAQPCACVRLVIFYIYLILFNLRNSKRGGMATHAGVALELGIKRAGTGSGGIKMMSPQMEAILIWCQCRTRDYVSKH